MERMAWGLTSLSRKQQTSIKDEFSRSDKRKWRRSRDASSAKAQVRVMQLSAKLHLEVRFDASMRPIKVLSAVLSLKWDLWD